jgi:hypothetical protein
MSESLAWYSCIHIIHVIEVMVFNNLSASGINRQCRKSRLGSHMMVHISECEVHKTINPSDVAVVDCTLCSQLQPLGFVWQDDE